MEKVFISSRVWRIARAVQIAYLKCNSGNECGFQAGANQMIICKVQVVMLAFMFDRVRNQMIAATKAMLHRAKTTATGRVKNAPRS
jgi:hypothetical protein